MFLLYILLAALVIVNQSGAVQKLQEYYSWKVLDYAYPTHDERIDAMLDRDYIPENNLPVGIEIWGNKIFMSVPRWREGIPSTLNYVEIDNFLHQDYNKSPLLIPYPDWKSVKAGDCETGLTTVYRIKADKCNRLWALDTGTFGIGNTTRNLCPYTLKIFDLNTDQIIRKYELRKEDIVDTTFIANIVVDVGEDCEDAHAYMSDELGYGLIVYSWAKHKSWRFDHPFFFADPVGGDFTIDGLNFQWAEEGIFSMVLSPIQIDGSRVLFFGALASYTEFAVSTQVLKDESKVNGSYHDFVVLKDRGKNTHITAKVMDENGVEFFTLIDLNAIGCWYSGLPYSPDHLEVIESDDKGLIFPADLKIDHHRNLWVISDQMSTFLLQGLNSEKTNFRIFVGLIDELTRGTSCKPH